LLFRNYKAVILHTLLVAIMFFFCIVCSFFWLFHWEPV